MSFFLAIHQLCSGSRWHKKSLPHPVSFRPRRSRVEESSQYRWCEDPSTSLGMTFSFGSAYGSREVAGGESPPLQCTIDRTRRGGHRPPATCRIPFAESKENVIPSEVEGSSHHRYCEDSSTRLRLGRNDNGRPAPRGGLSWPPANSPSGRPYNAPP